MTTDAPTFSETIDTIRNLDNVRRVSVSDNVRQVAVSAAVDYDGSGTLRPSSEALFSNIEGRLFIFGFLHVDSEDAEAGPGDHHAIEVWIFERA